MNKKLKVLVVALGIAVTSSGVLAINAYFNRQTQNDEQERIDARRALSMAEANAPAGTAPISLHDPGQRSCADVYNAIQRGITEDQLAALLGPASNRSFETAYGETNNGGFALYGCRDGEVYVNFERDNSHIETGHARYIVSYFSMDVTQHGSGYAPF